MLGSPSTRARWSAALLGLVAAGLLGACGSGAATGGLAAWAGGVAVPARTGAGLPVTGATAIPVPSPTVAAVPPVAAVPATAAAVPVRAAARPPAAPAPSRPSLASQTPAPASPTASAPPADHLVGPGTDVLVSPMSAYDCRGFSPPLPLDRVVTDPCAQPVTGVPLIVGHNLRGLLWNASVSWADGTVVRYGGLSWRIVQTRIVDHWITYYPMPPAGAGLQIRTCQPDGLREWVWDLVPLP
jgi:hypothetical protein